MTLRRLRVLMLGLPPHAGLWAALTKAEEAALKPTPEQIRARQEHYRQQKTATGGG